MIGDGSAAAMAADHLAESLHAVSPDATVALAAGPTPALVALVSLAVLVSSLALFVLRHRAASLSKAPVAAGPGGGSKYQPLATKDVAAVAATNGEERKGEGDKAERDDSKVAIGILFGTQTGTSEGFAKVGRVHRGRACRACDEGVAWAGSAWLREMPCPPMLPFSLSHFPSLPPQPTCRLIPSAQSPLPAVSPSPLPPQAPPLPRPPHHFPLFPHPQPVPLVALTDTCVRAAAPLRIALHRGAQQPACLTSCCMRHHPMAPRQDDLAEDSDGFTAKLKAFHAAFFLVATYGDGEPTDDAQRFFKWLHATAAHAEAQDDSPVPLQGLRFAVFGLGNRQYEHFNLMGKMLDKHLAALGGQRVAEVGLGDDDQCIEDDFKAWRAGLWKGFEALVLGRGAGGEGQQGEGAAGEWEDEEEEVQEYQVRFHSRVGQAGVAGENGELNGGLNGHVHEEMNGKMNGETNGKVNGGEKQVNGVGEHKNGGEEEEEQMSMGEAIAAVGWHSHSIGRARVAVVRELQAPNSDRSTLHVELDLSPCPHLQYEVGDHVAVFPENSDADVAAVAKCLGLDLDDVISLHLPSPSSSLPPPPPGRHSIRSVLASLPDLHSSPRKVNLFPCLSFAFGALAVHLYQHRLLLLAASCAKQCHPPIPLCTPVAARPFPCPNATSFFPTALAALHQAALAVLAHFASHPDEAARLKHLASDGGKAEYREWVAAAHRSLLEVLQAFPSARPPLAVFLASVAPRLQPRFYSISSHPRHEPGALHITCAVVRDITPAGRIHHGVCSSFLHRHLPLPTPASTSPAPSPPVLLPAFIRSSHFRPPTDPTRPIVMVGPGTGLAPFRAFLQVPPLCFHCPSASTAPLLPLPLCFHCPSASTAPLLPLPLCFHCPSASTAPLLPLPLCFHCPSALHACQLLFHWHAAPPGTACCLWPRGSEWGSQVPTPHSTLLPRPPRLHPSLFTCSLPPLSLLPYPSAAPRVAAEGRAAAGGGASVLWDYIYREELAAYEESGVLSALHVAFSRDGPSKVYVQHLLKQQAERVWQVVGRRGGSVYVCGDAKAMARDVHHALLEVAVEQGKMAKEAAVALLDGLAEQGRTTTTTRAVAARCAASAAPGRAAATSAENPTAAASPPPAAATAAATSELAALHSSTPTAPSCCSRLKPARPPCMCALLMLGQSSATCRVLHALLSLLL
ncbi:unnamed protein product [Closterium sp. NIES-65]|nr:unnamed protein product [Closterium sp. NIES-65]